MPGSDREPSSERPEEAERAIEFFRLTMDIVGYEAPNERLLIDWLHTVSGAKPPAGLNLDEDGAAQWRERLQRAVGHVRDGHRAAYYHRDNAARLVADLVATIREHEELAREVLTRGTRAARIRWAEASRGKARVIIRTDAELYVEGALGQATAPNGRRLSQGSIKIFRPGVFWAWGSTTSRTRFPSRASTASSAGS